MKTKFCGFNKVYLAVCDKVSHFNAGAAAKAWNEKNGFDHSSKYTFFCKKNDSTRIENDAYKISMKAWKQPQRLNFYRLVGDKHNREETSDLIWRCLARSIQRWSRLVPSETFRLSLKKKHITHIRIVTRYWLHCKGLICFIHVALGSFNLSFFFNSCILIQTDSEEEDGKLSNNLFFCRHNTSFMFILIRQNAIEVFTQSLSCMEGKRTFFTWV